MSKAYEALTMVGKAVEAKFKGSVARKVDYTNNGDINGTQHVYVLTVAMTNGAIMEITQVTDFVPYKDAQYTLQVTITKNNVAKGGKVEIGRSDITVDGLLNILATQFKINLIKVEVAIKEEAKEIEITSNEYHNTDNKISQEQFIRVQEILLEKINTITGKDCYKQPVHRLDKKQMVKLMSVIKTDMKQIYSTRYDERTKTNTAFYGMLFQSHKQRCNYEIVFKITKHDNESDYKISISCNTIWKKSKTGTMPNRFHLHRHRFA